MHDGVGLCLPLRVRQSPHHLRYQAGGDLADIQLGLPLPHHPLQRHSAGLGFTNAVSSLTPFVQVLEKSELKAKVSSASKVFLPEKNEATVSRGVGYSFFKNFSYYYNPLLYITFSALYFTFYNITIV